MPFSLRTFQILTGVEASLSFLKFGQHSSESDWHKTTEEEVDYRSARIIPLGI